MLCVVSALVLSITVRGNLNFVASLLSQIVCPVQFPLALAFTFAVTVSLPLSFSRPALPPREPSAPLAQCSAPHLALAVALAQPPAPPLALSALAQPRAAPLTTTPLAAFAQPYALTQSRTASPLAQPYAPQPQPFARTEGSHPQPQPRETDAQWQPFPNTRQSKPQQDQEPSRGLLKCNGCALSCDPQTCANKNLSPETRFVPPYSTNGINIRAHRGDFSRSGSLFTLIGP